MIDVPSGRVVLLGGGAVGSLVGGRLAGAGHDVVLIDGWPDHVRAIRDNGLTVDAPEGTQTSRLEAWDLGDTYRLRTTNVSVAFLTVKLYDTDWAAALLATWLPPRVPVVTLQNALVEERVARAVGWSRTLGAIGGGLNVFMAGPGVVRRASRRGASGAAVFKVGELHGRRTPRSEWIAALLAAVDTSAVTTDLWTERWAKLCANTMTSGISGLTGLSLIETYSRADTCGVAVMLAAEAITVGEAMGFRLQKLFGIAPDVWCDAAAGNEQALATCRDAMAHQAASMVEGGMSGTQQDLRKGRPTEVDFFNGFIAREAERLGIAAPTHVRIAALIAEAEQRRLAIGIETLDRITH